MASETLVVGNIYRTRVAFQLGSQVSLNYYDHRVIASSAADATVQMLADAISADAATALKGPVTSAATFLGLGTRRIFTSPPFGLEYICTLNTGLGGGGANPLPSQVTGLISVYSANPGRSGRGRRYIPFPSTTAQTAPAEKPNAAYVVSLDQIVGHMFTQKVLTLAGARTVTILPQLSRRFGQGANATFVSVAIDRALSRSSWATQRRRGDYGKQNLSPFS